MALFYRHIRGIFFNTSLLSSQSLLLSSRTCVSAVVESPLTELQATSDSRIAKVAKKSELRKMVEQFKLDCRDANYRKRANSYKEMVYRLTIAKRFSWIEEILEDQKQYMTIAGNENFVRGIISLYGNAGMFDHARSLFDEMPLLGYDPPTVISFNCLLEAYLRSGHLEKIEELFREIPQKLSITPNLFSYTILIKAYLSMGYPDFILSTMREMQEKEIKPDSFIYALLLDGLYKNGRVAEGEDIWDSMISQGIAPCIKCYNSRLSFLASEKRMKEALELFHGLECKRLKPDAVTFCVLFEGLRAENNLEEAKRLYKILTFSLECCRGRPLIWKILVPFATEMGDFAFAVDLCYTAIYYRTILEEKTLQGVLDGLVRESKVERARILLYHFRKFSGTYSCVLKKLPLVESSEAKLLI